MVIGEVEVVFRKILNLILAVLALPFVLLIRILSPFAVVRIFVLDVSRIGHVLPQFDMYVCKRKAGVYDSRYFDIFCFDFGKVANDQVKKMVARVLPICPFAFWVNKMNKRLPGWEKYVIREGKTLDYDLSGAVPNISFTQEELGYGQKGLRKLGIPANASFICFHARDAAYLNTHQPQINWDYHSYRNADINNYVLAAEKLVGKGYFAIRMGRFVEKAVKTDNPKIIDYATRGGTDFLDVYLSAHCRFFIAGSDGLALMPTVFRRPVVWVDFIPFSAAHLVTSGQLFIPKKIWSIKEKRFLTFHEMLNTEVARYYRTEDYRKAELEVINNSPGEILDAAMEIEERLNGTWSETEEDAELQQRFKRIVDGKDEYKFFGRIGAKFLKQHKELLGVSRKSESPVFSR